MTNTEGAPRLVLFGMDGATFDVIGPAIEAGKLPTIGHLMKKGSYRTLRSVIPPLTAPAWSSIMTGVNPGKHGIFEFSALEENSYNTRIVTSVDRKANAIWQLLNQAGLTVGVLNVPLTYPPEEIDGWMISGMMGAPKFNEAACSPPELYREVQRLVGFYPMTVPHKTGQDRGRYNFSHLQKQISSRTAVTLELLRSRPVDVLIIVCSYTDHVQHRFWGRTNFTTSDGRIIEDMVLYAYQQADQFLSQIIDFSGADTSVFVISDHGSGQLEQYFNMERFMLDSALTVHTQRSGKLGRRGLAMIEYLKTVIPSTIQRRLPLSCYRKVKRFFTDQKLASIDWPRTRACDTGSYVGLRMNVKGRESEGCIEPENYEQERNAIQMILKECRHPDTGESVFEVYPREELYHGPYVEQAPDLVGMLAGGSIRSVQLADGPTAPVWIDVEEMEKVDPFSRSGSHRQEGIFIAAGPNIGAQRLETEAQLVDIVPTVLYTLGLPIPTYCDGQVLTDLFGEDFLNAHPPRYADAPMQRVARGEEDNVYTDKERDQIRQRLQNLGYLE